MADLVRRHNNTSISPCKGFTIIELVVAILALAITGSMVIQLTNSTTKAMNKMNEQSKVDSAIAAHLEKIRDASFRHLCNEGCENNELGQEIKYDTTTLIPLCNGGEGNGLGNHLLSALTSSGLNPSNFNVQDYDSTAESLTISSQIEEDQDNPNLLNVTLSVSELSKQVETTIIPNAQRWCP